jgi:hypothetical protein
MTDERRRELLGDPLAQALFTLIDRAQLTEVQAQALGDYSALLIERCTVMASSAVGPLWARIQLLEARLGQISPEGRP